MTDYKAYALEQFNAIKQAKTLGEAVQIAESSLAYLTGTGEIPVNPSEG